MSSWRESSPASWARSALGSALLFACLASTAHAEALGGPEETCPTGSVWHEEAEPERHAVGELIPGRVGWCQQGDKKHGPMRLWWKSGELMREVHFEAGAETGRLTSFFPDGRPEVETRQRDGRVEGRFVLWHKTGRRARDMAYEGGRPHGYAVYWDEDGQVLSRGAWVDGKKVGVWETFHKNGVLKEMARWESGRLAGRQLVFSEGGRFVSGACWQEGERRWESKNEAETRTRKCHPW